MAYSVMKIRANFLALNSVLNPETSSLSPSAKSNGVRLVSANMIINHIKINLGRIIRGLGVELELNCLGVIKYKVVIKQIITKMSLIS